MIYNNKNNNNNNNERMDLNAYESSKLTIDPNFFKLGMRLNDHNNNTYVLVSIKQRMECDNKQYEYCLTFRKITKQECSNCGYVDFTINPYCQKCFLRYAKIEDITTNYGLHV